MTWFHRDGSEVTHPVTPGKRADCGTYVMRGVCCRCGGAGGCQHWPGFTCYRCGGANSRTFEIHTVKVYTAEKLTKLQAAESKRNAKRAEKAAIAKVEHDRVFTAWTEARATQLTKIRSEGGNDTFLSDLIQRVDLHSQILTNLQLDTGCAAVDRIVAKREAEAKLSYVGEIGARIEVEWTTDKIIALEDEQRGYSWSRRYIVIGHDSHGNHLKYFGSGHFPTEGETASCRATVKAHEEYRGQKQTTVERPKWAHTQAEVA